MTLPTMKCRSLLIAAKNGLIISMIFSAEISIYLASDTQGRGYGKQILNFIDQQITDNLDIKTVIAYVYENNLPSQKLFQKCGYQQCGVLPQISIIDGELRTLKIFVKHFNL